MTDVGGAQLSGGGVTPGQVVQVCKRRKDKQAMGNMPVSSTFSTSFTLVPAPDFPQ